MYKYFAYHEYKKFERSNYIFCFSVAFSVRENDAVRETGVSRHQGGPIEGRLEPPVHHRTIVLERKWKYSFPSAAFSVPGIHEETLLLLLKFIAPDSS